jgi:hypothetical protein
MPPVIFSYSDLGFLKNRRYHVALQGIIELVSEHGLKGQAHAVLRSSVFHIEFILW